MRYNIQCNSDSTTIETMYFKPQPEITALFCILLYQIRQNKNPSNFLRFKGFKVTVSKDTKVQSVSCERTTSVQEATYAKDGMDPCTRTNRHRSDARAPRKARLFYCVSKTSLLYRPQEVISHLR